MSTPSRRAFIGTAGIAATTAITLPGRSDPAEPVRPIIREPRATSGDVAVEPKWAERFTVTVGHNSGQIIGSDEKAIQAAVDYVHRYGGGTVQLLEGTFKLRNSVVLTSGVRLVGRGPETILIKEPSIKSKLVVDSDWYDQEITLADATGFRVGDGVCLRAKNAHNNSPVVIKRTLVARSGNRFKLDRALRENVWLMGEPTASTLFPLVTGEFIHGIAIENLTIDGNKAQNENLDGNYAGCIFLQDCRDVVIRQVEARNNNGDGISWQICHDVLVERCHSHGNTGLGLHPGSGSQRPIMRGNKLDHNGLGLFFCWGVKHGLAEDNLIEDNSSYGISVGHRDTDNRIVKNTIRRSGKTGILFRAERGKAFAGHRNLVEGNRIEDSGPETGIGIDVEGETEKLEFIGNILKESRGPAKRIGIRLGPNTGEMSIRDNTIEGFAESIRDQRKR